MSNLMVVGSNPIALLLRIVRKAMMLEKLSYAAMKTLFNEAISKRKSETNVSVFVLVAESSVKVYFSFFLHLKPTPTKTTKVKNDKSI